MHIKTAIRLSYPLRDAIRAREAANIGEWPGCDAVSTLDAIVEEERFLCRYLIRHLQDAHAARILARAAHMPGYMFSR